MEQTKKYDVEILNLIGGPQIVYKRTKTNMVFISVLVKCGSIYETKKNNGISHLLEHLIGAEGAAKDKRQRLLYKLERLGNEISCDTSCRFSAFHLETWRQNWRLNLELLLKMLAELNFTTKELSSEKSVIVDERQNETDAMDLIIAQRLFGGHSMSLPVEGRSRTVNAITGRQLRRWHQQFYQLSRMILIIVGDISLKKLISLVEKMRSYFCQNAFVIQEPPRPNVNFNAKPLIRHLDQNRVDIFFPMPKDARHLFFFEYIIRIFCDISTLSPYWEILRPLGLYEGILIEADSNGLYDNLRIKLHASSQKKLEQLEKRIIAWISKCAAKGVPKELFRRVYKQYAGAVKEQVRVEDGDWYRECLVDIVTQNLFDALDLYLNPGILSVSNTKKEVDCVFREVFSGLRVIFRSFKDKSESEG